MQKNNQNQASDKNEQKLSYSEIIMQVLNKSHQLKDETMVLHVSAGIINDEKLLGEFALVASTLRKAGVNVIVVHDYGNLIEDTLREFGMQVKFKENSTISDYKSIQLVEMVLSGVINKRIVAELNSRGANSAGLSGKDTNLIEATKYRVSKKRKGTGLQDIIDIGYIGEPSMINPDILLTLEDSEIIPVIAPVAFGANGESFILDSELTSAILASALTSQKLVFFSSQGGFYSSDGSLITSMTSEQLRKYNSKKQNNNDDSSENISLSTAALNATDNFIESVYIMPESSPLKILEELVMNLGGTGTVIYDGYNESEEEE
jgi:acetylglutamate kinase